MIYNTRKIVMSGDLNATNTLFGGRILAWVDEEAAIYAASEMKSTKIVTKLMSQVDFMSPAHLADMIEIGVATVAEGNTSITVKVEVRNLATKKVILTIDKMVFVNLGEDNRPKPWNKESKPEWK